MRAGSSGLGRLGLGLVALCFVEAVDQRLDDELDRQLVDVLHVLRVPVLERALHRVQERLLDFLQADHPASIPSAFPSAQQAERGTVGWGGSMARSISHWRS